MTPEALLSTISEILSKPARGESLSETELGFLIEQSDSLVWDSIFQAANELHAKQFHKEIYFFAPLYFSSYCVNECTYCGFRVSNKGLVRKTLNQDEFLREAKHLWDAGHRTMVLIAGEDSRHTSAMHIAAYLRTLKQAGLDFFVILEAGPLEVEEYRELGQLGVSQCLLFQETYDPRVYQKMHTKGPKHHFEWRYDAMERAVRGGISRIGLGILLGLKDWRQDLMGLIQHSRSFKEKYGVYPSSISLPRLRSAHGVEWETPEFEVSDEDYKKMLAILRLALPETGLILTTRETSEFREEILTKGIGVTHLSAGCSTVPGGYVVNPEVDDGQFYLQDHRSLAEVSEKVRTLGFLPFMRPDKKA